MISEEAERDVCVLEGAVPPRDVLARPWPDEPEAASYWAEAAILMPAGCSGSDPAPQGQQPQRRAVTSEVIFRGSDTQQTGGVALVSGS